MIVLGCDFTSAPSPAKPITVARCRLDGTTLRLERIERFVDFTGFEALLVEPGPWVGGFDFPFGQAREFLSNAGWPMAWEDYVEHVSSWSRAQFIDELMTYKAKRPFGAKQHRRKTDVLARSQSPQTLFGTPVAKMWFEGARRLKQARVFIPILQTRGEHKRVVIEAYPGLLVRRCFGDAKYKGGARSDSGRKAQRECITDGLHDQRMWIAYGISAALDRQQVAELISDHHGDMLDAVLCAVQAAWAFRHPNWGIPADADPAEGWISDPHTLGAAAA